MKITLIILFISAYSTITFAACDSAYENPRLYSEWLKMDITKKALKDVKKLTKQLPLDEKLDFYEELWSTLSTRIEEAQKEITTRAHAILEKEGQEAAEQFALASRRAAAQEYIPFNDLMIEDLARELNIKGLRSHINIKVVPGTNPEVRYKYITLKPDPKASNKSSKKLARYQKLFDIDSYTVDLFENSIGSSRGFYSPAKKRVDLGTNGIKSILIDDMPTFVVKHEGKHAGFARQRNLDARSSVYDSTYLVVAQSEKLTKDASIYPRYMSAEELYNWANDPYWLTERFRDIKQYTVPSLLDDLNNGFTSVFGTTKIAEQTEQLSSDFIGILKGFQKDIDSGLGSIIPLTSKLELAATTDEIRFLQMTDLKTGRAIRFHLPPEIRDEAQDMVKLMVIINGNVEPVLKQNGIESIRNANPNDIREIKKLIREKIKEQGIDITPQYTKVLDYIIDQQTRLKINATAIKAKSEELAKYLEKFVEDFHFARDRSGGGRSFLLTDEWQAKFTDLRSRYRDLGVHANEFWKGSPIYRAPKN